MSAYQVLVVDDEVEIQEAIEIYLKHENITVFKANDGLEALEVLAREEVHLIILDIMMPRLDGIKTTLRIREERNIPILMLSAKTEDTDKVIGLNVGADDYMCKPFNPLLGNYKQSEDEIQVRGLVLNKRTKTVSVDQEEVRLTATEYKILELLMEHRGRVFSIEEIYESVWKEPFLNGENTVAVHVRRIREKIEINPRDPQYLKVVWGIGYKLEK